MRISNRKRALSALLVFTVFGTMPASAVGDSHAGHGHTEGRAEAHSTAMTNAPLASAATSTVATSAAAVAAGNTCAPTVSCGFGCSARLTLSFCTNIVRWSGVVKLGPFEFGPGIEVSCKACECWYRFTDSNGNQRLIRKHHLSCGGELPGTEIHVQ